MRFVAALLLSLASPVRADVPRVVTDFGPVQSLVAEVMGDLGQPEALLPTGGDPHDFQLRPSQADLLATADLVIWVGPDLIPALGDAVASLAPQATPLALLTKGRVRQFADGGIDPHGWLDPQNAEAWVGAIAKELAEADPDHAAIYAANAARSIAGLTALDAELAARLAPVRDRPFVTYHDALGYFADHYGLALVGAIELSDASSPSAAQLARIGEVLARDGAVCVFPEVGRDPKFFASLTEGLAVRVGPAQDIEFIERAAGPGQYAALLRDIAGGLADCLEPR